MPAHSSYFGQICEISVDKSDENDTVRRSEIQNSENSDKKNDED